MTTHSFDVIPFAAHDGFGCNLWHLKNDSKPTKEPVLLVHGAGVRANIFNAPTRQNIIGALAEAGYDVWLENWRGSIDCPDSNWNLEIVAKNDHPAAVAKVCELTGATTIKAIIHCQGSTSFMISVVNGWVPQVNMIIANAVSLHPIVPAFSKFKLNYVLPALVPFTDNLNPQWGINAPTITTKALRTLVNLTHWEQDTTVGKFVSFTYGSGTPALWELENINDETKKWIQHEFASVPLTCFKHIRKCVNAGALVSADGTIDYSKTPPRTEARFAFFAGKLNKCFSYQSQVNSFNFFNSQRADYHKIHFYDTYSHLDVFYGKDADRDIFPTMIKELNA